MQDINILEEEWSKYGKKVIHRFGQPKLWNVWNHLSWFFFNQCLNLPSVFGVSSPQKRLKCSQHPLHQEHRVWPRFLCQIWDKESTAQKGRNCPELNVVRLALEAEQVWLLESAVVTVHYGVSAAHTTFPGPRKDCSGVCQGSLLQDFWPFFIMLVNSLPDFRDFVNYLVPFNNCVFCWH